MLAWKSSIEQVMNEEILARSLFGCMTKRFSENREVAIGTATSKNLNHKLLAITRLASTISSYPIIILVSWQRGIKPSLDYRPPLLFCYLRSAIVQRSSSGGGAL